MGHTGNDTVLMWDMFYLTNPRRYMYDDLKRVPLIYVQAWPYFMVLLAIENVLRAWQKKDVIRLNDSITSMSHAILQECAKLLYRGSEQCLYIWVYDNYRILALPWDSVLFWYCAAVIVDFCYYWMHRASHEIHIFWAQHQVHHSSEDFNVAVGVRQSVFQYLVGVLFYAPLALVVPPVLLLVHQQLGLLYQVWIHTETIPTLGPLEYVLNTPAHHRVHHGSNLRCLDKNYGGVLIIWDRIFGTFQEVDPKTHINYGLVYQKSSYNPVYLQIFYNYNVYNKWNLMKDWRDKLRSVVRGPSWTPGLSWTGKDSKHRACVRKRRKKYDVKISLTLKIYLLVHFVAAANGYFILANIPRTAISTQCMLVVVFYITWSLTSIGMLFEKSQWARFVELAKCLTLFVHLTCSDQSHLKPLDESALQGYRILSGSSSIIWSVAILVD
ncbi:alkylglycerol monooxygenase-like [Adelges cooleyi]|uniref:alkylglycerol monooxygenase-like n=1 Tax=Adelges cooleyi TaxID=133065 RepID=UPI00218081CA|nr:alkylglycerol monooxygenase-like [Adelges cooleyi]XP_050422680.1 alkylglycerol monooxygenase-like [Adelges cooleyi]